jgi:hypothetical protein
MLYPLGRASLGSPGASVSNLKPLVLVELFAAANTLWHFVRDGVVPEGVVLRPTH